MPMARSCEHPNLKLFHLTFPIFILGFIPVLTSIDGAEMLGAYVYIIRHLFAVIESRGLQLAPE